MFFVTLLAAGLLLLPKHAPSADEPAGPPAEAFGGKQNELRLVLLIKKTLPPKSAPLEFDAAKIDAILPWSKPVAGLRARIETIYDKQILVRLENVSAGPLVVPNGHPPQVAGSYAFELYLDRNRHWQRIPLAPLKDTAESGFPNADIQLNPGESSLVWLNCEEDRLTHAMDRVANMKIIFRQSSVPNMATWSGELETPPHRANPGWNARQEQSPYPELSGQLPFPEHFPAFSHLRKQWGIFLNLDDVEAFVDQKEMSDLRYANVALLNALELYDPTAVRTEFERRMLAEEDDPVMKLLLAVTAARVGGQQAALFLLESMKETDYRRVVKTQQALHDVLGYYQSGDPPDWIIELAKAAMTDERMATGKYYQTMEKTPFAISRLSGGPGMLAGSRKEIPYLIELVERGDDSGDAVRALASMRDPRVVPVLLNRLKIVIKTARQDGDTVVPHEFHSLAQALADQHVKEATPLLLERLEIEYVPHYLELMGDPRAIPPLRELVAADGKVTRVGESLYPDRAEERMRRAQLALAMLEDGNRVARLARLLHDPSWGEHDRTQVVHRLETCGDPRAIEHLVNAVKTDPSGWVVIFGISALPAFKSKAAVDALIDCFDADFQGKEYGKGEGSPYEFLDRIARSLHDLTDESFGPDKQKWTDWWRENRDTSELK